MGIFASRGVGRDGWMKGGRTRYALDLQIYHKPSLRTQYYQAAMLESIS